MSRPLRVTLTIFVFLGLLYVYVGTKLFYAFQSNFDLPSHQVKWSIIGGIFFLNLYPILLFVFYITGLRKVAETAANGSKVWDVLFGYAFWAGLLVVFEVTPLLLTMDFLKLPFYPFYNKFKLIWLAIEHRLVLGFFLVRGSYVFIKILVDTNRIRVSKTLLTYKSLPFALDGLKIVHISDLHASPRTGKRRVMRYIKKVNKLQPDVIFFTGDLVGSDLKFAEAASQWLSKLTAKEGIYACLGDHDINQSSHKVRQSLQKNGIMLLEDRNQFIPLGNESLLVTVLTNVSGKRPNLDKVNFLMGQQPRGVLDFLVTHQPTESIVELAAERGYHIFLAGHTHGGQIVPQIFGITFSAARFETQYYRGSSHLERMLVNINNGLGFSLAPIRYNAPAEVSLIKIIRQPG
ncbi:MAG: metallophosphoesterase [bacterium]